MDDLKTLLEGLTQQYASMNAALQQNMTEQAALHNDFQPNMKRRYAAGKSLTAIEKGAFNNVQDPDTRPYNIASCYLPPTRLTNVNIPEFDGTDLEGWLLFAEQIFRESKTNDATKLDIVRTHFSKEARTWHESYLRNRNHMEALTWHKFKKDLLLRFGRRPLYNAKPPLLPKPCIVNTVWPSAKWEPNHRCKSSLFMAPANHQEVQERVQEPVQESDFYDPPLVLETRDERVIILHTFSVQQGVPRSRVNIIQGRQLEKALENHNVAATVQIISKNECQSVSLVLEDVAENFQKIIKGLTQQPNNRTPARKVVGRHGYVVAHVLLVWIKDWAWLFEDILEYARKKDGPFAALGVLGRRKDWSWSRKAEGF